MRTKIEGPRDEVEVLEVLETQEKENRGYIIRRFPARHIAWQPTTTPKKINEAYGDDTTTYS